MFLATVPLSSSFRRSRKNCLMDRKNKRNEENAFSSFFFSSVDVNELALAAGWGAVIFMKTTFNKRLID